MKSFLRVLSYAQNIVPKLTQFFIYSILGVIFGVFNILLVIPMLSILFDTTKALVVPKMPEFSFSSTYVKEVMIERFLHISRCKTKFRHFGNHQCFCGIKQNAEHGNNQ